MRHLPLVGHLPTSPFVTRYLVAKQDNNGDTFLICQADPAELLDHAAADEVTPGPIGSLAATQRQRPAPGRARTRHRAHRHRPGRARLLIDGDRLDLSI